MTKHWRWAVLVALVLSLALAVGCSDDDDDDDDDDASVIMPLAIGNQWDFSTDLALTLGGTALLDSTYEDTLLMTTTMTVDGEEFYMDDEGDLGFRNGTDGTYIYAENDTGATYAGMAFKYPVSEGDSWDAVVPEGAEVTATCISTNASVSTEAGDFSGCIQYQYVIPMSIPNMGSFNLTQNIFAKPGIGPVKIEGSGTLLIGGSDADFSVVQQLVSYSFN